MIILVYYLNAVGVGRVPNGGEGGPRDAPLAHHENGTPGWPARQRRRRRSGPPKKSVPAYCRRVPFSIQRTFQEKINVKTKCSFYATKAKFGRVGRQAKAMEQNQKMSNIPAFDSV